MQITRKTEYALLALLELAKSTNGDYLKAQNIARQQGIPASFIPAIAHQLSRSGIIEARRGKNGGIRLRRQSGKISVAEIIEIFEGPFALNWCLTKDLTCRRQRGCPLYRVLGTAQTRALEILKKTSLRDLVHEKSRGKGGNNHQLRLPKFN